jgi:hypothetical protein
MIVTAARTACTCDPITSAAEIEIDRIEAPLAAIAMGILATKTQVELGRFRELIGHFIGCGLR